MENPPPPLIDQHHRALNYLRISVTDRCNLRCLYCMPPEGASKLSHEEILSYEEILRLARIALGHGITKIRLTGGEPLVRKDFCDFIGRLSSLEGLVDLSLTTNGVLLGEKLEKIKKGGITRLNVSLDSLKKEKYRAITGFDGLDQVLDGLSRALEAGFQPVKINMVVMKGVNDDEVTDFAALSLKFPYHVRFIEYMPIGMTRSGLPLQHVPNHVIQARLEKLGRLVPVPENSHDGPAERYRFEGAPGEIGFIGALTHHFCRKCNRLRLTARGQLRPCLLSDREVDLKGPMRNGASDEELSRIFLEAALAKPSAHGLDQDSPICAQMSAIGG
jgi:GTP 3',8-cyclase